MDGAVLYVCAIITMVGPVMAERPDEDDEINLIVDFSLNFGWWCDDEDYHDGCNGTKRYPTTKEKDFALPPIDEFESLATPPKSGPLPVTQPQRVDFAQRTINEYHIYNGTKRSPDARKDDLILPPIDIFRRPSAPSKSSSQPETRPQPTKHFLSTRKPVDKFKTPVAFPQSSSQLKNQPQPTKRLPAMRTDDLLLPDKDNVGKPAAPPQSRPPADNQPQYIAPREAPMNKSKTDLYIVMDLCLNKICSCHCEQNGFPKGSCTDSKTCCCQPFSNPRSVAKDARSDLNILMDLCLNNICLYSCQQSGFAKGSCIDSKTCYCQSISIPQPVTKYNRSDLIILTDLCLNYICLYFCQQSGFVKGSCPDSKTCLCQSTEMSRFTPTERHRVTAQSAATNAVTHLLQQSTAPDAEKDIYIIMDLCLNNICSYHCQHNGFFNGSCIDSKSCHCRSATARSSTTKSFENDLHIVMDICLKNICSYYCQHNGFSEGSCTDLRSCRCHSNGMPHLTNGTKKELYTVMDVCSSTCPSYCKQMKISKGECVNSSLCHCSNVSSKYPEETFHGIPTVTKTMTTKKTMTAKNTMTTTKPPIVKSSKANIVTDLCLKKICTFFCQGDGFSRGSCTNPTLCHCYNIMLQKRAIE